MRLPVVQVGQVHLTIVIHIHGHLDLHGWRWFHKAHGRILWMGIHQPYAYGNVVGVVCEINIYIYMF